MDRKFQSMTNGQFIDLIPYLKERLEKSEDLKLYIGSDSQNAGKWTNYAIVIVLHKNRSGGHVIYSKKRVPKIVDRFSRLWNELEDSIELAKFLQENGIQNPICIDLDFNPDPRYGSNNVLRSALGYVESFGFDVRVKPFSMAATYCADKICNRKAPKRKKLNLVSNIK